MAFKETQSGHGRVVRSDYSQAKNGKWKWRAIDAETNRAFAQSVEDTLTTKEEAEAAFAEASCLWADEKEGNSV